jgi:glycine dehydrogenase
VVSNPPRIQPSTLSNFTQRHIGPNPDDVKQMLDILGLSNLDDLIDKTVPQAIRFHQTLNLPAAQSK